MLQVTQSQLSSIIEKVNSSLAETVGVRGDLLHVRCGVEDSMRITFELAHLLGLTREADAYRQIIPMAATYGSGIMFGWKIKVVEEVEQATPLLSLVPDLELAQVSALAS